MGGNTNNQPKPPACYNYYQPWLRAVLRLNSQAPSIRGFFVAKHYIIIVLNKKVDMPDQQKEQLDALETLWSTSVNSSSLAAVSPRQSGDRSQHRRRFYYDIDFGDETIGEEQLERIEDTTWQLAPTWGVFQTRSDSAEAKKTIAGNPFKLELISELEQTGETISLSFWRIHWPLSWWTRRKRTTKVFQVTFSRWCVLARR